MEILLLALAGGAYWYWWRRSRDGGSSSGGSSLFQSKEYMTLNVEQRDDGSYRLESFDPFFYAPAEVSENEEYIAAFSDDGPEKKDSNMAILSNGGVMLLEGERLCWTYEMPRAHAGGVANTGHVAAGDWMRGGGLRGTFYLFSPEGEVLTKKRFGANLHHSGIAANGVLAWCTTASSRNEDSNQLAIFGVPNGEMIFKRDKLHGQPVSLKEAGEEIHVETDAGVSYVLRRDGTTKNTDQVAQQIYRLKLTSDDARTVFDAVQKRLEQVDFLARPEMDELMKHLRRVEGDINLSKRMAMLERRKGEVKMAGDNDEQALEHFHAALQLDEKVGVKRKTKKLEKKLSD